MVSVGIPTFNRPDGLRRSLDCILRQTYTNLEIIVSDNASPGEETRELVEGLMLTDNRIRYYRQSENRGPVANFQFVLNEASGEFFMWMSDDDWRHESYVESLMELMQDDDEIAMAFCDLAVHDEFGDRKNDVRQESWCAKWRGFSSPYRLYRQLRFMFQDEGLGKACIIYGLMRRSLVQKYPLNVLHSKHGFYGLDNLLVFSVLGEGRLALLDRVLFGITAGNQKQYSTPGRAVRPNRMRTIESQARYLTGYLSLSSWPEKVLIAGLLPVKVILFYWHTLRRRLI